MSVLSARFLERLDQALGPSDVQRAQRYPGAVLRRLPVHTAYVPADRLDAATVRTWGDGALAALDAHAPDPVAFATLAGVGPDDAHEVVARTRAKLAREPIEDLRVDLEDGYGMRSDEQEDADAAAAVAILLELEDAGIRPPFVGFRIKSLEPQSRARSIRSLETIVAALAGAGVPDGFVITLPKVTAVAQIDAMVALCEQLEDGYDLAAHSLRFEIQVETTPAILAADGTVMVAQMIGAAAGRCAGLHYGTYDYSAAAGISAAYQSMEHPAADYAKAVMQVAAAGTGVALSDGSTNILPVGDTAQVHAGWALHARLVRRSLERGFYQGWDLHPAQLPTRYAATYAFYRSGLAPAADRLRRYLDGASSGVLEEPATAQALAGYLCRGLDCGAVDASEVTGSTGLSRAELDRLRVPAHLQ
ncbi:MAG: hypothetical protein JWN20_1174 [Jatrophihabitantaceae bacterium]|nr:hypothetical protein [Jatrophihabitantaceae bacterium]